MEKAHRLTQTQAINPRCKLLMDKWLLWTCVTPVQLYHFNIPNCCIKYTEDIGAVSWMQKWKAFSKKNALDFILKLTEMNERIK